MAKKFRYFIIAGLAAALILGIGCWRIFGTPASASVDTVQFDVERGASAGLIADNLARVGVTRHPLLLKWYLAYRGLATKISAGHYIVARPATVAQIVAALQAPIITERTITILPGWDLRDIADYLQAEQLGSITDWYALAGHPARLASSEDTAVSSTLFQSAVTILKDKPKPVSLEGYLAPETYRLPEKATLRDVARILLAEREKQFTPEIYQAIAASGHTLHEILTLASILEREVRSKADRAEVADIFWRRLGADWPFQADSTVQYAVGKKGDLFTTMTERDVVNPWNTYKYRGLPPGPICNPSLESIQAALNPEKNNNWFFLTMLDGTVKYARTSEEQARNVAKYLR